MCLTKREAQDCLCIPRSELKRSELDCVNVLTGLGLRCSHMTFRHETCVFGPYVDRENQNQLEHTITKTRLFKYIENFTTRNWKFSCKNSDIFHTSAQNIDCGYSLEPPRRGGSNEYPQCMFLSRNNKNNVYPCKPQFYCIKVWFKGVKIIYVCFRDDVFCACQYILPYSVCGQWKLWSAAQSDLGLRCLHMPRMHIFT